MIMDFNVTADLTDDQLDRFYQMKRNITEIHGNDEAEDEPRLLRFLIAREFDVDKATEMLSNSIKWRRKYGINDILKTYQMNEVLEKFFVDSFIGFSKYGNPVIFGEAKSVDLIGLAKSASKADFMMYAAHQMENFSEFSKNKSEEEGKLVQSWIFVIDFDKFPLSQVTNKNGVELFLSAVPMYEANYPERLETVYVINASIAFTIGYSLVRPLIYERTRKKFRVFGRNGWQEELLKVIDADVLPEYLGGNRTDPDGNPMCNTIIKRPGTVPRKYYKTNVERNIANKPDVRKYIVSRRSRIAIKLEVPEAGSRIEWEFQTENYDIGFGLHYVLKESVDIRERVEDVIIPIQKVDTKIFSETGTYLCEKPGTYVITFDNSFSWLRSKELYVRADVVSADNLKIADQHM